MSQSPLEIKGDSDSYIAGWLALNSFMRQGYSWSGHERNCVFLNTGANAFADVSALSGFGFDDDGRAVVPIDWDHDGDLDLWTVNRTGPRVRFLRNELATEGDFVSLQPVGVECNTDAIGARIELHLRAEEGETAPVLVRARRAGEGLLAQGGAWLTFGIGKGVPERAVVRWPGGEAEEFTDIARAGRYTLVQGSGETRPFKPPTAPSALEPREAEPPPPSARARVVLPVRVPMPELEFLTAEGEVYPVFGVHPQEASGSGRPGLLTLWASWCAPCVEELRALEEASEELKRTGLEIVALNVEGAEQAAASEAFLKDLGWSFWNVSLKEEHVNMLDVLQGALLDRETRIPLPTSFLVDPRGDILVVYFGPADPAQVARDVALVNADATALRDAATPFGGLWHDAPASLDLDYFAGRFERRGLPKVAEEFRMGNVTVSEVPRSEAYLGAGRARARVGDFRGAIECFDTAIEADPEMFSAHRDLGLAYHSLREYTPAIEAYSHALSLSPEDQDTWYNLGLAKAVTGDLEGARAASDTLTSLGSPLAAELVRRIAAAGR